MSLSPSGPMPPGCARASRRSPARRRQSSAEGRHPRIHRARRRHDARAVQRLLLFRRHLARILARAAAAAARHQEAAALVLIGVNSFLILVTLAALFGIWFGRTGGR